MVRGTFHFNEKQRELILKMDVPDMIELFSLTTKNISDFLTALRVQPRELVLHINVFELTHLPSLYKELDELLVGIHKNMLCMKKPNPRGLVSSTPKKPNPRGLVSSTPGVSWQPVLDNYRILGIYCSEHLNKNPFVFCSLPEKKKPKLTITNLFFEMSVSELGKVKVCDFLNAEVIPPAKERALKKALEKSKTKKKYTVSQIFTRMPLSKVGNLTLSEFFGAEVK